MKKRREHDQQPHLPPELAGTRLPRYRKLRRNIVIITSIVAVAPLIILTAINYWQDQLAYQAETNYSISQILSNTKRTLEFIIEERQAALSLVVAQNPYDKLAGDRLLAKILQDLKQSFGGFIDLGVINDSGRQLYYTGPYDLKNRNYEDQIWFHKVVLQGSYVSDVFMGHREFPHFVIAVRQQKDIDEYFILRATIDMALINRQMYSLNLDLDTDAFIINRQGILQTESAFYGSILQKAPIKVPTGFRDAEIIQQQRANGARITSGYAFIEGSSFILMAIRRLENPLFHWLEHRSDVLWFLIASIILILFVITYGASRLVKQLREADLRRVKSFHNIEYTNKMATVGRMAAGVAHEINNPMAIINEKAGLMKDLIGFSKDFPKKDKMLELVDSVLRSVDRCSRVTHRLLGFAKRMEIRNEEIDIKELINEVIGFQKTEITHKNIELNIDFQEPLPHIESDRGQLQQVFLNIVTNALAAVKEKGKVDISVAAKGKDRVVVAVTDNGVGISEENLKHIFEPFFSTKGEFGTGLGLSITRDIVEKLGGEIDVESVKDKGTRFVITLPIKRVNFGE